MYLRITNVGVAPVEGYLLLGVSTTRNCGVAGTVGQFGSGSKHAINLLLRHGLKVVIYCGLTKLEFTTRDEIIDDGLVQKTVKRVVCKMGGTSTRTVDTGWVLDFGALDWDDAAMALREFVSNAIDRTVRESGDFLPAIANGNLAVEIVADDQLRAKNGHTQVFVELGDSVREFYEQLPKRFLHFSERPEDVSKVVLTKANRNLNGCRTAVIYREGVFVCEIQAYNDRSLFDYNFRADQLDIDESRNSDEHTARMTAARLMKSASVADLTTIFRSLVAQEDSFEANFEAYYLCSSYQTPTDEQRQNWQTAWRSVAGDGVMCGMSTFLAEIVERKGYKAICVKSNSFIEAARQFGIPVEADILSISEKKGREKLAATASAIKAVDTVWGWLESWGLTNGKQKPPVGCFRDVMNAGEKCNGFADTTGVYLADTHASGVTKDVLKTALEECVHYVTGATDGSRDIQDFLFDAIVQMAA